MQKRTTIICLLAVALSAVGAPAGAIGHAVGPVAADPIEFNIDPGHSSVEFRVRHLGLSRVTGRFGTLEGSFTYDPDDPAKSAVSVTIDATSVDTGVERRDSHLRSEDFFEVETSPTLSFTSTGVRVVDAENLEIVGDLTLHGTTREVVLETEFLGMAPRRGGQTAAFEATTRINRHDFGLTWNNLQEGLQLVGDNVDITIRIEANTPREG